MYFLDSPKVLGLVKIVCVVSVMIQTIQLMKNSSSKHGNTYLKMRGATSACTHHHEFPMQSIYPTQLSHGSIFHHLQGGGGGGAKSHQLLDLIQGKGEGHAKSHQLQDWITNPIRGRRTGSASMRRKSTETGVVNVSVNKAIPIRRIMSGLILTMGPITTHSSFVRQGPTALRQIHKQHFLNAASQLEAINLGRYDPSIAGGVFFKRHPSEVKESLEANPDLAKMEDYVMRYSLQVPASVGFKVKEALIMQGYLNQDQFK